MNKNQIIESLKDYFDENAVLSKDPLVGVEFELFTLDSKSLSKSFSGSKGIEALLHELSTNTDLWTTGEVVNDRLISLDSSIGSLTLEPASQIELSSKPRSNLFEIFNDWNSFSNSLLQFQETYDFALYGMGIHPFQEPHELELLPKPRYRIMNDHFLQTGTMGRWMMRCSASTQVTADYTSIEDLFFKIQISFKLAPFTLALFANSCFWKGKPSDYLCLRGLVWANTDSNRSGIPRELFRDDLDLDILSEYLLKTPAMFQQSGSSYCHAKNKNFFEIHPGEFESENQLRNALETHLSQIFTETRVKNYLEFRTADAQAPKFQMSVPAFLKGIFNDSQALLDVAELLGDFSSDEILDLYKRVPRDALATTFRNFKVLDIVKKLLDIAASGLDRQAIVSNLMRSEQIFLHPLMEIVFENSYCPAQYFLRSFEKDFDRNLHEAVKISKY